MISPSLSPPSVCHNQPFPPSRGRDCGGSAAAAAAGAGGTGGDTGPSESYTELVNRMFDNLSTFYFLIVPALLSGPRIFC